MEGIFGVIMICFFSIYQNPFREIIFICNNIEPSKFILLIFLLVLYLVFSAVLNIYKILCNILYSPMTKSLTSYFLNSGFIIYYFLKGSDFITEGKGNFFYFFINLVISVLVDFLGLIYNEVIILKFCGLTNDTHEGISYRANSQNIEMNSYKCEEEDTFSYALNENEDIISTDIISTA